MSVNQAGTKDVLYHTMFISWYCTHPTWRYLRHLRTRLCKFELHIRTLQRWLLNNFKDGVCSNMLYKVYLELWSILNFQCQTCLSSMCPSESQGVMPGTRCKNSGCKTVSIIVCTVNMWIKVLQVHQKYCIYIEMYLKSNLS